MRALVIAPQPFFSPRGTPLSVYYRTLVTAELGVDIDLLTYGQGEDVDLPGVRILRIPEFAFLGRIPTGPSRLKLFLDGFMLVWTIGLLLRNRYDFVQAHEEAAFFCRLLKPFFRFKLVYDMHSSLPAQLGQFNYTRSRLLVGLFERLERQTLRHADAVVTICPSLAEYASRWITDPGRHFLIENSIFDPIKTLSPSPLSLHTREEAPLPENRVIVLYAGTFEPYQGLDVLLSAFAQVLERRPDAFLLMVGGTPEQVARHRLLANQQGLDGHCRFTGSVERSLATHYQDTASVLLSPRTAGINAPLKVYAQLASGVPLVATRVPAHTQILDESVCFLVDPNPESLARGILAALNDASARSQKVARANALYSERYARERYVSKMKNLLGVLG